MTIQRRTCAFLKPNGQPCKATPMADQEHCFWHSPEHQEEVAEARRLGGLRRRREMTITGAYGFEGLESVADIRCLLLVAAVDTLSLDNSFARSRILVAVALAASKLLETGELEERITELEASVHGQQVPGESVFDVEHHTPDLSDDVVDETDD
ncbi:MAG: hypothetical protein ACE5Q6_04835 [Dehalococcoidia bacterium]